MDKNNIANIVGTIASQYAFSHNVYGEDFYLFYVSTNRLSGYADILPVLVSSKIVDTEMDMTGTRVEINGTFRSYNNSFGGKHLILYIFADSVNVTDKEADENYFSAVGFTCKQPTYRKTPNNREIADIIIAVNRPYKKSDYLPVIAWSRNAIYISEKPAGTRLFVEGRIQSREYMKTVNDGKETRVAYEISASRINVCPDTDSDSNPCEDTGNEKM